MNYDYLGRDIRETVYFSTSEFLMTNHKKQYFQQVNISQHYNTSGDLSAKTGVKASFLRKPNVSEQTVGSKI